MKKIATVALTLISVFLIGTPTAFGKVNADSISVQAKSAYLCDYHSGKEIFAKNENERRPIASMTKIMLLLLAFEKNANGTFDFNEEITVSKRASGMGGSQVFLQADKNYKVSDLIKSIIVASANDASVAIAERLFGSEENAVKAMNDKAKQLKLVNTLFSNCTGLTKPTQHSSAKDVALTFKELLNYQKYLEYSSIYLDELVHPDGQKTQLTNTNKLVRFYNGCDGGKTGFTNEAGFCISATAKRGNMRIIAVIINASTTKERFADCSNLFDYAFANFASKQVLSKTQTAEIKLKVNNGKQNFVDIVPESDFYLFGEKNSDKSIKIDLKLNKDYIKAPVKKGAVVGEFSVYEDGVLIKTLNAVTHTDVKKSTVIDIINEICKN